MKPASTKEVPALKALLLYIVSATARPSGPTRPVGVDKNKQL